MKRILLITLLLFFMFSCKKDNVKIISKQKTTLNRKETLNVWNINDFLGKEKWIEIILKENKYINYKRCDSDNRSIMIKNKLFVENVGQEIFNCKLLDIIKIKKFKYKVVIENDCSYGNVYILEIIDFDKKVIKWNLYNDLNFFATPKSLISNYKSIVQPCTDCFPPEECP